MSASEHKDPEGIETIARFTECQDCGSTDFMMRRLGKEMVEAGLIDEGMDFGLDEVGGPIVDPRKLTTMLARSIRPGMYALRDVCIGCGRLQTVKIEKRNVVVGVGMKPAS